MKQLSYILLFFIFSASQAFSQQTIRGTITDKQTLVPLVNAQVVLLNSEPVKGVLTDENGEFRLDNVPVGRQSVRISYVGYHSIIRSNLIVNSAQELILEVAMEEKVKTVDEIVISSQTDKKDAINELTTVSARTFSVEEAMRYAGSRNDPARMAQNFAGVSNVSDNRNDIIIRGNSPAGVLWRMEGIEIPNPSHYGALGTTGGPVSMINSNNLSNADFLTSAFPAEYGNALAGVFDLNLRNGNNQKHELMAQVGFNGLELGIEGPFSKNSRASYIANYRYSTLGIFNALGINFGTGAAVPQYQDLTFKIQIPTKKSGRLVLFGMGGNSNINFLDSKSEEPSFFNGEGEDLYNKAAVGVVGLSHTYLFNPTTYGKLVIAVSGLSDGIEIDSLSTEDGTPVRSYARSFQQLKYSGTYQLNKKFNSRNHLRAGVIFDWYNIDLMDSVRLGSGDFRFIRDFQGNTGLAQAYIQWKHHFSDQLTLNTGGHYQYFLLNNSQAIEPRMGLKYQASEKQSFSLGAGLHNQIQPIQTYFIETLINNNDPLLTNKNLGFTRSLQFVAGYDRSLGEQLRLKTEIYYQFLSNAAVESKISSFSMLNAGADFSFPSNDSLVNEGTGRNYGMELTLEKFFDEGYYFLLTTSLFDSKYTGSDEVERNTAFNGNYIVNLLGGKEFQLGKNTLSFDAKVTYAGGKRYTPIDLAASIEAHETIRDWDQPFTAQYPAYFRTDIKTTFRMNLKKFAQEWSVDLQNVTNRKNVFTQDYSDATQEIKTTYQIGLFPVVQYRILF